MLPDVVLVTHGLGEHVRFLDGVLICSPEHAEDLLLFERVTALEGITEDRVRADWRQLPQIAGEDNVDTCGRTTSDTFKPLNIMYTTQFQYLFNCHEFTALIYVLATCVLYSQDFERM